MTPVRMARDQIADVHRLVEDDLVHRHGHDGVRISWGHTIAA